MLTSAGLMLSSRALSNRSPYMQPKILEVFCFFSSEKKKNRLKNEICAAGSRSAFASFI